MKPTSSSCCTGVLLPRIIAREHRCFNHLCVTLCSSLPACLPAPLRLVSLHACGMPECTPSCSGVAVRIPVTLGVCDACGQHHTAASCIEVEVCLPPSMQQGNLYVQPDLQLCCARECSGGFEATVHLSLCLYLVRLEPCMTAPPKPACPQLPLYPQPRV